LPEGIAVEQKIEGCGLVPGTAKGEVLVTSQSISFWGGVDPATGAINDPRHELFGHSVTGKVLAFPFGKGSSTGSLIMLELIRIDKAPAAIVNIRTEPILATGPIVGHHFYGRQIPIISLEKDSFQQLQTGQLATVNASENFIVIHS
jgi:predicted aconitase with swiveling domain